METLIAMRLIAPQDRAAVEAGIGEWADPKEGRELVSSLPSLARRRMGSFNFTAAAEKPNAENVLVLHDPAVAYRYGQEWERLWEEGSSSGAESIYLWGGRLRIWPLGFSE